MAQSVPCVSMSLGGSYVLTRKECPGPYKSAAGRSNTQEWAQRNRSCGVAVEVGCPCIPKRRGNKTREEETLLKGPDEKCEPAPRMTAYLCPIIELCEYLDAHKGIQAHLMAAVQDSHGPCHDKPEVTPKPSRVRCIP